MVPPLENDRLVIQVVNQTFSRGVTEFLEVNSENYFQIFTVNYNNDGYFL